MKRCVEYQRRDLKTRFYANCQKGRLFDSILCDEIFDVSTSKRHLFIILTLSNPVYPSSEGGFSKKKHFGINFWADRSDWIIRLYRVMKKVKWREGKGRKNKGREVGDWFELNRMSFYDCQMLECWNLEIWESCCWGDEQIENIW
jgi:hypothetical protein